MTALKSICVFCGSKAGINDRYRETAAELGRLMAEKKIHLIFGGGSVGLMGVVSNAVLDASGEVTGVIPTMLSTKELLHPRVTDMRQVKDMHARKALMAELSDAFIALPGGYGTFEELFEVITWAQLGVHEKKIGLLNVAGYYDPLIQLIDHSIQEGFIKLKHRDLIVVEEHPDALLQRLEEHRMPTVKKWLGPEQA